MNNNLLDEFLTNYEGYNLKPYQKNAPLLNFSPGPTTLPREVMKRFFKDINENWIFGATPMEISHRSPEFLEIKNNCENLFRELLEIPNDYSILWTHGGGHGQFSAVPLNLSEHANNSPNYFVTGTWSNRSYIESNKFYNSNKICQCNEITEINDIDINKLLEGINDNGNYIYLCSNETINGLEFRNDGIPIPSKEDTKNKIMVVDMSSDLLSKRLNWNNIDVAFACAPKNFGISGLTITIVKKSLLTDNFIRDNEDKIPSLLDWKLINNTSSFWNTLPVFNLYITEMILKYYKEIGGIEKLENDSTLKSSMIYNLLDNSNLYQPLVRNFQSRSKMNIPFYVNNGCKNTTMEFLREAFKNNIVGLRTKTPFQSEKEALRVSLYNPISVNDTLELVKFMIDFENSILHR